MLVAVLVVLATVVLGNPGSRVCKVAENSPTQSHVCDLLTVFPGLTRPRLDNLNSLFRLQNKDEGGRILLELTRSLDRESLLREGICRSQNALTASEQCAIFLEIYDSSAGGPRFLQLTVIITDINDNGPTFDRPSFEITLPENSAVPLETELPSATDPDAGINGSVVYSLQIVSPSAPAAPPFTLVSPSSSRLGRSPRLRLLNPLDREAGPASYSLLLIAHDAGSPPSPSQASLRITVNVADVNDHPPRFNQSSYRFVVSESLGPRQHWLVGKTTATDQDVSSRVTVSLATSAPSTVADLFAVAPDGSITARQRLKYTRPGMEYRLPLVAVDSIEPPQFSASATAIVRVLDVNDHAPHIVVLSSGSSLSSSASSAASRGGRGDPRVTVVEDAVPGTHVAKISVTDDDHDSETNARVDCKLDPDVKDSVPVFVLSHVAPMSGPAPRRRLFSLTTAPASHIDRETLAQYRLLLLCHDFGSPALTASRTLLVTVTDINDNGPRFSAPSTSFLVKENSPPFLLIGRISASDSDWGESAQTRYRLLGPTKPSTSSPVDIDSSTGVLTTTRALDRETEPSLVIFAQAYDHLKPELTDNVTITITVRDVNDNRPIFSPSTHRTIHVSEDRRGGVIGRLTATDEDEGRNGELEYFLISYSSHFQLLDSGEIVVRQSVILDRESESIIALVVGARDQGRPPLTATTTVSVILDDVNDNDPRFHKPRPDEIVSVPMQTRVGTCLLSLEAVDRDMGENGTVSFNVRMPAIPFTVEEGCLVLNMSLQEGVTWQSRKLVIIAKDHGTPSRQTLTELNVVFSGGGSANGDLPGRSGQDKNRPRKGRGRIGDGNHAGGSPDNESGGQRRRHGSNGGRGRSHSERGGSDLILSVGIGLVLLIFVLLLLLVSYFCVSIASTNRKRRRRHGQSDEISGITKGQIPSGWSWNAVSWKECCPWTSEGRHGVAPSLATNDDVGPHQPSTMSSCNFIDNKYPRSTLNWPDVREGSSMGLSQWDRGKVGAASTEDPRESYSYREFLSPAGGGPYEGYWQYSTIARPPRTLQRQPDLIGDSSVSSDEVKHILFCSQTGVLLSPRPERPGYISGSPRIANSFV